MSRQRYTLKRLDEAAEASQEREVKAFNEMVASLLGAQDRSAADQEVADQEVEISCRRITRNAAEGTDESIDESL